MERPVDILYLCSLVIFMYELNKWLSSIILKAKFSFISGRSRIQLKISFLFKNISESDIHVNYSRKIVHYDAYLLISFQQDCLSCLSALVIEIMKGSEFAPSNELQWFQYLSLSHQNGALPLSQFVNIIINCLNALTRIH